MTLKQSDWKVLGVSPTVDPGAKVGFTSSPASCPAGRSGLQAA